MAKRYEDRHARGGQPRYREAAHDRGYTGDRGYGGRGYDERGYMERMGDEVRSWFGDEEAERRRHVDEARGGGRWSSERERERSRWNRPDWRRDDGDNERQRLYGERTSPGWSDRERGWRPEGEREWPSSRVQRSNWDRDWDRPRAWGRFEPQSGWSADEGRIAFERRAGGYWGRGPRNYNRPDSRIYEDVCDRLTFSEVDAENIEVAVANGEVTLSGFVHDRWDKRRAEEIAEEVPGVRDVHNNIRVTRGEGSERGIEPGETRGIGTSDKSSSEQPGTVLGVNPTEDSRITRPR